MKLSRGSCFGSCPAYTVEVRGTGEVHFTGESHVLVPGEHAAHLDPAIAACLFEAFRKADFWSLRPRYAAQAFDLPTYQLTLSVGGKTKTVIDYLGRAVGMPKEVTDLENALDGAAETHRWIAGDTGLIDWLAATGFDFHSKASATLAVAGVRSASDETLVQLVERGAPLDAHVDAPPEAPPGTPPPARRAGAELLNGAIRNGKADLFRRLVDRGWLRELGLQSANEIFADGAAGCRPALVDAAIEAGLDVNAATPAPTAHDGGNDQPYGETALSALATSYDCADEAGRLATAQRLLTHGANPNIRNSKGETAIFKIENPDLLNLLLAHGADISARDKEGNSAVFSTWNDPVVLRLLEAGASPEGHYFDGNSLEKQAKERKMVRVQQWLADHKRAPPSP
jgi:ankyrin repeat protein